MDDLVYDKIMKAGRIAGEAREFGLDLIKPGVSYHEVAEKIEQKIFDNNASLAFPANIAVNEKAAHYTPSTNDEHVFKKGDLVKIDVGAHVDGYIGDTAATVEVEANRYNSLIGASSTALENAIAMIKPELNLRDVGKKIEKTINKFGFKPIDNLTGHSMERYNLHSGVSIPNVTTSYGSEVEEDMVLAIEPFATDGKGHVNSGDGSNIYRVTESIRSKMVRRRKYKLLYKKIRKKFNALPFSSRDFTKHFSDENENMLKRLSFLGMLKHYPQLIEQEDGIVSQTEHTMIVTEDGCEVTTKI
ncbi:MAG: type II methionyl aminopeptidase [Candidatus Thermoplasmatota archaeon]